MKKGLKTTGWIVLLVWAPLIVFTLLYAVSHGFMNSLDVLIVSGIVLISAIALIKERKFGLYVAIIITSLFVYFNSDVISSLFNSWDWKNQYILFKYSDLPLFRRIYLLYTIRIFPLFQLILVPVFLVLVYINRKRPSSWIPPKQQWMVYLISCAVPLIICSGWYVILHYQMRLQQERNHILEEAVLGKEGQIPEIIDIGQKKQELLDLMRVYEVVHAESAAGFIELLPILSDAVPDAVSLKLISYHYRGRPADQELLLEGVTLSKHSVEDLEAALTSSLSTDKAETSFSGDENIQKPIGFNMKINFLTGQKAAE